MCVSGVPHLEVGVSVFKVIATLSIIEPILNKEMNEDYVGIGPNSIDLSTLIAGFKGSQVLGGCMRDHFLSSCIMFRPCVSVGVSDGPRVVSSFIVVTFCVEGEPADHGSDLVVVILKVFPSLDVTEIGSQGVAAASDYEIQQI